MINRLIAPELVDLLADRPAVALVGPRQVGKTTLVNSLAAQFETQPLYLDLESSQDLARLQDAELYLSDRQRQLVIIDEVQRMPQLFPLLRSLIDRHRVAGRFLLLGSASPQLLQQSSESLAGRIAYLELQPLSWPEVKEQLPYQTHWLRGGYPDMLLANSDRSAIRRMNDFIQTYVERDLPALGLGASPARVRTLLSMLVSVHGNQLNVSELARSLGLSVPTIQHYLDFLEQAFLIRRLPPYFVNIGKRLVKSPKLYLRDSGMFHALAAIGSLEVLSGSLYVGSSWEGYVVQQVMATIGYDIQPYFYRTADGSELDILLVQGTKPVVGIEIKYTNAPTLSRGNYIASRDLGDIPLLVVTPSADDFRLQEHVQVCSLQTLWQHLSAYSVVEKL
ncbi:MAG: ATP-binding protein [Stigonema ocellatum SAG 48.90 = DSM 106950]|uniref:ATP-binding protein n=1 Tax=Spirosoma sp. TaxID=1899569 RepID=UPI00262AA9BA|nr:ATP-binding protein [Spirosoma sp.]MBR8837133.1 ATP-binding protein [Stigonema ocellatum SAG 48.90 = DSM 106950]MCX6213852.1 ATP-binding protein [Spirosoma sp.]